MTTPLYQASLNGHIDAMKLLIEYGANVNEKNKWEFTPLHEVSYKGHIDAMKLLIEYNANVNEKNKWGETPLHRASYKDHIDAMKLLIDHGANVVKRIIIKGLLFIMHQVMVVLMQCDCLKNMELK